MRGAKKPPRLEVVRNIRTARPLDPNLDPWERQPEETDPAWEAFQTYRDLGPKERSMRRTAEIVEKSETLMVRWSGQWSWVHRAQEWDREVDRRRREAAVEAIEEMSARHARQAQAYLQALMQPAIAVLEKVREDPAFFRAMLDNPQTAPRILELLARYASVMPTIANVERLARGEPTAIERREEGPEGGDIARNVISDPETSALAQQLYERVAGVG